MLSKLHSIHIPNFDFSSPFGKLIVLILFILVISFVINHLLENSFLGPSYRIFVAPGVILHELSHAFLCLLTGARITKISFFDKTGGSVEHRPSKIPVLGGVLISLAPFVFGAAAIYFLSRRLGINEVNLAVIDVSKTGIISFYRNALSGLNLVQWQTWIILYLVLSIAVTMTPSLQDFRNIIFSVLFLGIAIFLVYHFTAFRFSSLLVPQQAFILLSTVSLLLILGLTLSLIVYILSKIIKTV